MQEKSPRIFAMTFVVKHGTISENAVGLAYPSRRIHFKLHLLDENADIYRQTVRETDRQTDVRSAKRSHYTELINIHMIGGSVGG